MRPAPSRYHCKPSLSKAYPRPAPPPQRTLLYTVIAAFVFVCLLFYASPSVPVIQDISLFHHTPTHKPPAQKNSTSGDAKWYSDWKWLYPFSATITFEGRPLCAATSAATTAYLYRSMIPKLRKRRRRRRRRISCCCYGGERGGLRGLDLLYLEERRQ